MIALLQRVSAARVAIAGEVTAEIGHGLLALIGIERADRESQADRLLERLLGYRVFADEQGRMNHSVRDISGGLLLVPQFTLAADSDTGMRPSFSSAASPTDGERLFTYLARQASQQFAPVAVGRFGADMQVSLTNDGPVTFRLQVKSGG